MTRFLGVDLAWGEGGDARAANESGLVCIDDTGVVLDAGWATGIDDVADWIIANTGPGDVVAIDAPLVVHNAKGARACERQVGQLYKRWKFSAHSSNLSRPALGGVTLRKRLEAAGLEYADGVRSHLPDAIVFFECYPHTTIVGAVELGYDDARPPYKKLSTDTSVPILERRARRAAACDELVERITRLEHADPPLQLGTHEVTRELVAEPAPLVEAQHKHREDLIDAVLAAWTAGVWSRHGTGRCVVLGSADVPDSKGRIPTLIAIAREDQRSTHGAHDASVTEAHMNDKEYTVGGSSSPADLIEFVEGGAAQKRAQPMDDGRSTRAPSPAPTTVELLKSATWHLEHARVVADVDDVAFEAARSALAEAVFDLERVQYGES